ncbi:MAG: COX15/CtaA family protein [Pseudomonadota bacterium]
MSLGVAEPPQTLDQSEHGALRAWLLIIAALIIAMIAVGGATRLTDSGLSITEWQPILGVIPPLNAADWQLAFDKYKQIPEYSQVNLGMSLAEFKFIFWWEWAHRFLGRLIGLAFAGPLLFFWLNDMIPRGYRMRLLALLALGGLQGFIGWYMVQSGLSERVDVSQYRLALHLCMAFLILGLVVWTWADLSKDKVIYLKNLPAAAGTIALTLTGLLFLQVALGAFVAGTKAGLVYNTWPLMDGQLLPAGLYASGTWFESIFEDHLTIQFNHRIMAYILVILAIMHGARLIWIDNDRVKHTAHLLAILMIAQAALGIWTLIAAEGAIPIGLGIIHQTMAAIVLAVSVLHLHAIRKAYQ